MLVLWAEAAQLCRDGYQRSSLVVRVEGVVLPGLPGWCVQASEPRT